MIQLNEVIERYQNQNQQHHHHHHQNHHNHHHHQQQHEKEKEIEDEELDNLEISHIVAATEPHVSQLMNDLEVISKEKEKLFIEKELIEKKCNVAISLAEKQKVCTLSKLL